MNKQGPGKISWTDYTWNPIKGLCPVGCTIPGTDTAYCYARGIYRRFFPQWEANYFLYRGELGAPDRIKKPSKIFVCSTLELFHDDFKGQWRKLVFDTIKRNPQHTFQILTKMPENIDRPMPENVWLGVSVPRNEDEWKADLLFNPDVRGGGPLAPTVFVSAEPMLDDCHDLVHSFDDIDWLIIGRLTGHGHKYDPKREWIEFLVDEARASVIPIFMKHNLKEIWGPDLIQEWPKC